MEKEFYNTVELCQKLKISKPTMYKLIKEGGIPHRRLTDTGRYEFNKAAVDRWLKEKERG